MDENISFFSDCPEMNIFLLKKYMCSLEKINWLLLGMGRKKV